MVFHKRIPSAGMPATPPRARGVFLGNAAAGSYAGPIGFWELRHRISRGTSQGQCTRSGFQLRDQDDFPVRSRLQYRNMSLVRLSKRHLATDDGLQAAVLKTGDQS